MKSKIMYGIMVLAFAALILSLFMLSGCDKTCLIDKESCVGSSLKCCNGLECAPICDATDPDTGNPACHGSFCPVTPLIITE